MLKVQFRYFLVVACCVASSTPLLAQAGRQSSAEEGLSSDGGVPTTQAQEQSVPLELVILGKLRKSNDAEIALAKLAQGRASNQTVKEIAEHLLRDHQGLNKQLEQLYTGSMPKAQPSATRDTTSKVSASRASELEVNETAGIGASGAASGGAGQGGEEAGPAGSRERIPDASVGGSISGIGASGAGAGGKGQGGDSANPGVSRGETAYSGRPRGNSDPSGLRTAGVSDPAGLDAAPATENVPRSREVPNSGEPSEPRSNNDESLSPTLPVAYWRVVEQASDDELAMTENILSGHEGSDFDMAYLGQQQLAHVHALAELKALETSGPRALRATAAKARITVSEHLTEITQALASLKNSRSGEGRHGAQVPEPTK